MRMCDLLLPISGTTIPRMIGRGKLVQRIWSDLTRVTASNLSIVGPRLIGKTVLMKVLPEDRLRQVRLLQLLTGSKAGFESRAKRASKDTCVLLNAIHSFRNRSEHSSGQPTHAGVAVAALFICLELLSCLARDLE